ncbi:MAG: hypothetical protein ABIZ36_11315 [Gemmatimonadaceae bacterium]
MNRRVIGIAVIVLWVAGLLFLYKRNGTHSSQQFLVQAGMRVSPDVYYYTVQRSGAQVGVASSGVDTTKQRIVAVDFLRGAFPVGARIVKLEARSEARFTRGMRLRDFVVQTIGDMTPFTLRGVMQEGEDKTLRVTTLDGRRKPVTNESVAEEPVFISSVAPILLMLKGEPKIGDSIVVSVFDPVSRAVNPVTLRIERDSLFLVPDSASLDSTSGRWVKAHQTSVRGWRVGGNPSAPTTWVDISGRLIAAVEATGLTFSRTTFELSFANFRLDHSPAADSALMRAITAAKLKPPEGKT